MEKRHGLFIGIILMILGFAFLVQKTYLFDVTTCSTNSLSCTVFSAGVNETLDIVLMLLGAFFVIHGRKGVAI